MTNSTPLRLVFMLEEKSAKHLLDVLLPKILPPCLSENFICISHQGKSDLQKSIPIKLSAWQNTNDIFIILHDLDNHSDCTELKGELQLLCAETQVQSPLIRIVCQELEAWYFGDLNAVECAFPKFSARRYKNQKKYRRPDEIDSPSNVLKGIVPGFSKGKAAKIIPQHMTIENNTSPSFRCLIAGIQNLVATHNPQQNCAQ